MSSSFLSKCFVNVGCFTHRMFAGIFLPFNLLQTSACIGVIEKALLILSRTKIKSPSLMAAFEKSFED